MAHNRDCEHVGPRGPGERLGAPPAGWLVVAITVLVFVPTLGLGRVALDDLWLWSDDSPLRAPSAATLHHVWFELDAHARHDVGTEYLPVRDVVVAADMAVWGAHEQGFHATQLVLYAGTVLALGGLLIRFGLRRDLAWSDAVAAAERATRSGHASTLALYAQLLARAGRAPEALGFAERAALRRPEDARCARGRLELMIALGRYAEAEPIARALIARDPSGPSQLLLGRVLAGRGKLSEAAVQLDLAAALGARAANSLPEGDGVQSRAGQ